MIQFKGALVLGALIGTGIGVLIAPEKGSDTRDKLKKEGKDVKDQLVSDFKEVKEDLSKATTSGKEKFKEEAKNIFKLITDTRMQRNCNAASIY